MIELILDECLEAIREKRATLAECLAKYPQYAEELAPLLEMAVAIENLPEIQPSEEFKQSTRARLLLAGRKPSDGRAGEQAPPDAIGHVTFDGFSRSKRRKDPEL